MGLTSLHILASFSHGEKVLPKAADEGSTLSG
jgi:hypothetical protein